MIRGCFLRTVSYLPHVKKPATKGHLSCKLAGGQEYHMNLEFAHVVQEFRMKKMFFYRAQNQKISDNCSSIIELFKQDNVAEYCRLILNLYRT